MSIKKIIVLSIILSFSVFGSVPTIAVVELGGDITKSESKILSDKLASILIETNKFKLVERSMMEEILKEQGFQQTGCTDQNCAVEIGQLLGVQKMCTGSIGKIGSSYSITLRIVNVATAEIESNASFEFKGTIEDILYEGLEKTVSKLLNSLFDESVAKSGNISITDIYNKKVKVKRAFSIVSTVATVGTVGASIYSWINKKQIHDKYMAGSDQAQLDKYIEDEDSAYKMALIFTGVSAALLPTTIVLWAKKVKKESKKELTLTPLILPGEASLNLTYKF